jgi:hypothetical protein
VAPYAFLSYQTADKKAAGRLKGVLTRAGVKTFLAHEDITVSEEWRLKILEEIAKADIFICLLSESYMNSAWCVQESGIAAFRPGIAIIPLSLDSTTPKGFISHVQSVRVGADEISLDTLMPAFVKYDFPLAVKILTDQLARAGTFRFAEAKFEEVMPLIPRMSNSQVVALLEGAAANGQVHHATLCAREYIPPILKSHGRLLKRETRAFLKQVCAQYA